MFTVRHVATNVTESVFTPRHVVVNPKVVAQPPLQAGYNLESRFQNCNFNSRTRLFVTGKSSVPLTYLAPRICKVATNPKQYSY